MVFTPSVTGEAGTRSVEAFVSALSVEFTIRCEEQQVDTAGNVDDERPRTSADNEPIDGETLQTLPSTDSTVIIIGISASVQVSLLLNYPLLTAQV